MMAYEYLFYFMLFNYKLFRAEIAIKSSGYCRKLQHTIVGVRYSLFVIHRVAFPPYHFLTGAVCQYLHRSPKHNASEESRIAKVNTGPVVFPILCNTH